MKKILQIFALTLFSLVSLANASEGSKKELVFVTAAIRSLDSVKATDSASFNIIQNTQETLLIYDKGKPVLGAAKSFDISPDGLTYTFHLKDGLKWSDGKPLTASDYKFAWERLLDPKTGASYAFFLFPVKNANDYYKGKKGVTLKDVGIKATDDKTLVVTLAYRVPYFTQLVAFAGLSPQRADVIAKYGNAYATKADKMLYSGPFIITNWVKGAKIELKKNPYFWDAKNVALEKAKFLELKENSTQYQMFLSNQLDVVEGKTGEYIQRLNVGAKQGKYQHINVALPREYYMSFNFKKPEFKSFKIRTAFSAAVKREEFVKRVIKAGIPAYGFVTPGILVGDLDYRKEVPQPLLSVSVKDPKALFIEGLKELGMDADPSKHSFDLLQRGSDAQSKIEGEYFKNMWEKALGVKINLLPSADFADFLDKDSKGLFDLSFQGWGADYNSPLTFLDYYTTWNGYNTGKYVNKEVDELIKKAQRESDPKKRLELFKKVEYIYTVGDPATAPLYYKDLNVYMKNYVQGLQITLFGGKYQLRWVNVQ